MIRQIITANLLLCLSLGACAQEPAKERSDADRSTIVIDLEQQETRQRLERIEERLDALEVEAASQD